MKKLIFPLLMVIFLADALNAQMFRSETARKASERMAKRDVEGAVAILTKAIEDKKDVLEAYQMRGNINGMMGNLTGAIADYTSVLAINPNDANTLQQRAMYRGFRRDSAGALTDYDAAIANGLKTERIYSARAGIKRDIGDLDGAAADYHTALAFDPDLASAYMGLSGILEKKGDADAALALLQDFLDRYEGKREGKPPVVTGTVTDSINIKRKGQEKDGSQGYLIGVTRTSDVKTPPGVDPVDQSGKMEQTMNLSMAYFTLGRLYAKKDQFDSALSNYEKGLRINKDDPYGYKLRSEVRMKKGDLAGTIEDLTSVINAPMHMPDNHLDRGLLLLLQNKDAEAQTEFDLHLLRFPAATEFVNKSIDAAKKLRGGQVPK